MKEFIASIFPAEFKHNVAYWRGFTLGLVLLILAVTQLFRFEELPGIIKAMHLAGFGVTNWVLAIAIPLLEIASIPYLISMRVTTQLRSISKWSGLAVCVVLIALTLWTTLYMGASVQSGLFGGTIATDSGWWTVLFSLLLTWSYVLTMRELPPRRAH